MHGAIAEDAIERPWLARHSCVLHIMAKGRFVWAPGWSPNRSHSYGEDEAQAKLTEPTPQ